MALQKLIGTSDLCTNGIIKYSANNANCQINTTGFRLIDSKTIAYKVTYTLYADESIGLCKLILHMDSCSIASGQTNYENAGWIPSKYRPQNNLFSSIVRSPQLLWYVWTNGTMGVSNFNNSTLNNQLGDAMITYSYK